MRFCLGARVALQLATLTASLAASGATSRPVAGSVGDRRAAFDIPCARCPRLARRFIRPRLLCPLLLVDLFALSPSLSYKFPLVLFLPSSLLTFALASCSVANPLCIRLFAGWCAVVAWFVSPFGFSVYRHHDANFRSLVPPLNA